MKACGKESSDRDVETCLAAWQREGEPQGVRPEARVRSRVELRWENRPEVDVGVRSEEKQATCRFQDGKCNSERLKSSRRWFRC